MKVVKFIVLIFILLIIYLITDIFDQMNPQLFVSEFLNLCQNNIYRYTSIPILYRSMGNFITFCSERQTQECELVKVFAYLDTIKIYLADCLKDITIALGSLRTKQNLSMILKMIKTKLHNLAVNLLNRAKLGKSSSQRVKDHIVLCSFCFKNLVQIINVFYINLQKFEYGNFCKYQNYKESTPTSLILEQYSSVLIYEIRMINQYLYQKKCVYFTQSMENSYYEETMKLEMLSTLVIIRKELLQQNKQQCQSYRQIINDEQQRQKQIHSILRKIINENYLYYNQKWKQPQIKRLNKTRKQEHLNFNFLDKRGNWVQVNKIFGPINNTYYSSFQKVIIMKTRNENNQNNENNENQHLHHLQRTSIERNMN